MPGITRGDQSQARKLQDIVTAIACLITSRLAFRRLHFTVVLALQPRSPLRIPPLLYNSSPCYSMARLGLSEKGMLPLPTSSSSASSSRRPRTYFPSNPSSQQPGLITHLRSRTRLTNLAVVLILCLTISSLLLNASHYLSAPRPSTSASASTPYPKGYADPRLARPPPSIESTIERDPRMTRLTHMIMVPGHAIWTGGDKSRVEEDDQWVLEPMQKGGRSVRTFLRHIELGVEMMKDDPASLLVLSG